MAWDEWKFKVKEDAMPFTTTIAKQVPVLLRKESEKELSGGTQSSNI